MHKNEDRIIKVVREKGQVTYKASLSQLHQTFHQKLWKPEKILDRCYTDTKRAQMTAQATIPSQTFNYHRWRSQSIPLKKKIHTLSFHKLSPSKNNNRNFIKSAREETTS